MDRKKSYKENDFFSKKARQAGLRARSYFKLEEIDYSHRLIKKQNRYLDLGAAPGSWSEYLLKKTNGNCLIDAVDLQAIKPFSASHLQLAQKLEFNVRVFQQDVFLLDTTVLRTPFNGVISDMAPQTTGVPEADSFASYELVLKAAELAKSVLCPRGFFLAKYFEGAEVLQLKRELSTHFSRLKMIKPKSSRRFSREVFVLGWLKPTLN